MAHKVGNGAIIGIASEDGVAAKKRIGLIDRSTMKTVARTVSDEFGAYSFNGLNPAEETYIVFAVDDEGDPKKAALIFDYVKPIPAHQGGFFWSNWYYIAVQKEPLAMVLGFSNPLTATNYDMAIGAGKVAGNLNASSATTLDEAITPGAANLPAISASAGNMSRLALNKDDYLRHPTNNTAVSAEVVLDLSVQTRSVGVYLFTNRDPLDSGNTPIVSVILGLEYDASTNTIWLYRQSGVEPAGGTSVTSNRTSVASYVVPIELRSTVVHIAASITYSVSAAIYVNGVQVAGGAITGATKPAVATQYGPVYLGSMLGSPEYRTKGIAISHDQTDFISPMYSVYGEAMTEAEASTHYQALFGDMLPQVTGYARAVVEDYPVSFFRFKEFSGADKIVDELRPQAKNKASALASVGGAFMNNASEKSIVVGGSGVMLDGRTGFYNDYAAVIPASRNFLSVEFIAQPTTVDTYRRIFFSTNTLGQDSFFLGIDAVTNRLVVTWREINTSVTHKLTAGLDTTAPHYYVITIDKKNKQLLYYVDSVLTESISITSNMFDAQVPHGTSKTRLCVAADLLGSPPAPSFGFVGYLSELAVYNSILTRSQIVAHYEARLII